MTETQERFLRTVLTRVPLDSVVELHLFPPIRRGTVETGVAVIATQLPPEPVALVLDTEEAQADSTEHDDAAAAEPQTVGEAVAASAGDASVELIEASEPDGESPYREDTAIEVDLPDGVAVSEVVHESDGEPDVGLDHDDSDGMSDGNAMPADVIAAPMPSPRTRILTAAYRHTIKGVERGKWIVDVQEEADAPLDAVELVLRGVRHRSTEPADPELIAHDTLAALTAASVVAPAA